MRGAAEPLPDWSRCWVLTTTSFIALQVFNIILEWDFLLFLTNRPRIRWIDLPGSGLCHL
jgi:hypothetical protein